MVFSKISHELPDPAGSTVYLASFTAKWPAVRLIMRVIFPDEFPLRSAVQNTAIAPVTERAGVEKNKDGRTGTDVRRRSQEGEWLKGGSLGRSERQICALSPLHFLPRTYLAMKPNFTQEHKALFSIPRYIPIFKCFGPR